MNATTIRTEFPGHTGDSLAARLDIPAGPVRAFALFAHCFTCSKDILAAKNIAVELARVGIAVMRFDFTGLGSSKGEFSSTNFSSNAQDLLIAADYLRTNHRAPSILIGHSLGGAAVLAVAADIPEVKAVATIGAPSDVEHVLHNFHADLATIEEDGEAEVSLGGRPFRIEQQFVEDARTTRLLERVRTMKKALMVLHSPIDQTVGVENAGAIFTAAKHPKSFVSLDNADHLLTRKEDARFAAQVIARWAGRYLPEDTPQAEGPVETVQVTETLEGKFQQTVFAGKHRLLADEPATYGGLDTGPSPYDFLSIALGACTGMTLRMYAERKGIELGRISVNVSHAKIHATDCTECDDATKAKGGRIDSFERVISVAGGVAPAFNDKLIEIAGKCPVHRTLEASSNVVTRVEND
ncbi:bifunctional alpha/beta hydrolase/OsmC family protein [Ahrensia sp. R2A130]|uniref:bifunctional alpha/beta hydrolase/OsmC family protein n=1 Tax=Ahrensia sp. R2A130 TaxID=744979 RepID=UPI00058ADDF9|nr:bifunctional alpha/beta hydrolase/OsmC family protein [Ahrensia sp. R2A130]